MNEVIQREHDAETALLISQDGEVGRMKPQHEQMINDSSGRYDKHLGLIQDQLETAKDPASYETYWHGISSADTKIKLFTARTRGGSHIIEKIPCQDYCIGTAVNGCTVLADADGVGSCEHSDIGSRIACEAVVQAVQSATEKYSSEEQLVDRLMSISFRERLVSIWVKNVLAHINAAGVNSAEEQLKEFCKFGSTIMFAVITEKWIVVGNLGDGQVLVFNDYYGVKLRLHLPKWDSRVRCLTNARCAREDFQIAKYPREFFNGVLLSTDGLYESFDKGDLFFDYGIQMKERFLGRTPYEPYQAFCYKEKGEPYKDISKMRTGDDCSISMALDEREITSDYDTMVASILQHAQAVVFNRWSLDGVSFYAKQDDVYADVVVTKGDAKIGFPDELESAVLEVPIETWREGGLSFAKYADMGMPTMEFMHSAGMLRCDKTNPTESAERVLGIYLQIKRLQDELRGHGLELNESAMFNVSFDGTTLHIRKEAVRAVDENGAKAGCCGMERCFDHLIGAFESGNWRLPVFDVGYVDRGIKHHRANNPEDALVQLVRIDRKICMKNISSYLWRFDDGKVLAPGESFGMAQTMNFTLLGSNGEELETYKYVGKELL